ncbi:cysteine dioxygenase family protein [Frankia sp. CNm7]|uniref:Cysteine dioxygenase family protein n=2 Tax=Frankia nepalensis TaxID=1836974 RepID=A0A937UVT2_9ACTN|nr:cysteine dioxygenase family protein [Frankia nepalensis]MBL7514395.1 cysteine dioxygenase family protein [Frankia nepalensis]MBL7524913.1 cysteine dioxygenase family protein [Frankia nepalensis]MBL7633540.1 cysteine dioxygenase family protein [Frankia nepalensis]
MGLPPSYAAALGPAGARPATRHPGAAASPRPGLADLLTGTLAAEVLRDDGAPLDLVTLAELAGRLAAADGLWRPVVRHDPDRRWYTRLLLTGVVEVWLIGWAPGQHTEVHDHGGALGALAVADGEVEEDVHTARAGSWEQRWTRRHSRGEVIRFAADHVHRVVNRAQGPATTIHAYSPPELPLRYASSDTTRAGRLSTPIAPTAVTATSVSLAPAPVTGGWAAPADGRPAMTTAADR